MQWEEVESVILCSRALIILIIFVILSASEESRSPALISAYE